MNQGKFLEILFPDDIRENDLQITLPATRGRMGCAQLVKARITRPGPNDAPNGMPVLSYSGAKIGVVVDEADVGPPYTMTYLLKVIEQGEQPNE